MNYFLGRLGEASLLSLFALDIYIFTLTALVKRISESLLYQSVETVSWTYCRKDKCDQRTTEQLVCAAWGWP